MSRNYLPDNGTGLDVFKSDGISATPDGDRIIVARNINRPRASKGVNEDARGGGDDTKGRSDGANGRNGDAKGRSDDANRSNGDAKGRNGDTKEGNNGAKDRNGDDQEDSDDDRGGDQELTVWNYYGNRGEYYDRDLVGDANNTVDSLLIFAGLFSAVVTAFISQTYPMLQPNPGSTLTAILLELQHPGITSTVPPFVIPAHVTRVNCYFFAGLFTSMIVAFLSILIKQWARSYQRDLAGVSSPHLRARIRHFRYHGVKTWHFVNIVGMLSIIMHFALFVSAIGIIDLLLSTAPPVIGYVALTIFVAGVAFFIITTILPLVVLDAPFRSPLSDLLTKIKTRILKSSLIPRGNNEKVEEGLEDHLEQSQGDESEEDRIVRTQFHLDLDILSHLLGEADKSTERWLLDLCFEKLPQLSLLEQRNPHLILKRRIIIEVYVFLAKGCVRINKNGEKEPDPTRLHRARKLCKFLTWFLSLRSDPDVKDAVRQLLTGNGFDPRELPNTLAKDYNDTKSVNRAYSALGRLEHLLQRTAGPEDGPDCVACAAMYTNLESTLQKSSNSTTPSAAELASQKSRLVTTLLIQRMDCLLGWDKRENMGKIQRRDMVKIKMELQSKLGREIQLLQLGFKKCVPTHYDMKIWERALKEKESMKDLASESLREVWWYAPLMDTLKGLQTARTVVPRSPVPLRPRPRPDVPPRSKTFVTRSPPILLPDPEILSEVQAPQSPTSEDDELNKGH